METQPATETLAGSDPPESRLPEQGFSRPATETLVPAPGSGAETLVPAEQEGKELGFQERKAEESPFVVGDLVWGKIKSHPWWPGQVYDPSGASDRAKKLPWKSHLTVLVAYFGDGTFAWCHPSQLRPFAAEFGQMVRQSSSKSFVGAVEDALVVLGKCLESELYCHCIPQEARGASAGGQLGNAQVANFAPLEFLDRLRDVACDVLATDLLEGTMLKSWVVAFGKGWVDGSVGYRQRRGPKELVDKIDLDVPPGDLIDGKEEEEEECWLTGGGQAKGPEISEQKSCRSRKKRSMAALISEMDLDTVELSDSEEEKVVEKMKSGGYKKKGGKETALDAESGGVKGEEESGSGRRERKKSKYLSPPYTYLSGFTKCLVSPRRAEARTPKKGAEVTHHALHTESAAIFKCNSEALQKEEDSKSPLFKVDGATAHEILTEFLSTARDPLHLKWNRWAKVVRGFFAMYRNSMYSSGADFEAYQQHQCESCGIDSKSLNEPSVEKSAVRGSGGKGRKRKDGANGNTPAAVTPVSGNQSEKRKPGRKRKEEMDGADSENRAILDLQIVNVPVESRYVAKNRKRKDGANDRSMLNSGHELINRSDAAKAGQKTVNSDGMANGESPPVLGHQVVNHSGKGKSGQKRRKRKDVRSGVPSLNLDRETISGPEGGRSGQKRKKKDGSNYASNATMAALSLNFSAGGTLPSKEDLISAFSKYGTLIECETELLKETGRARLVFAKCADAEKAFNSDKNGAFGPPFATYRLSYLPPPNSSSSPAPVPVPQPPLPYIRKSLERMISTLSASSSPVVDRGLSDGLKPDTRDNLVGEMQGLLKKVDKMLKGPAAGPFCK